nr:hypothetical protein Iba_chr12aCG20220 [Ipomoea batatas]
MINPENRVRESLCYSVQVGSGEIRNDDDKSALRQSVSRQSSFTILIFTSPLLGSGLVSGLTLRLGAGRSIDSILKKQSKSYSEQTDSVPEEQRPERIQLRDSELFVVRENGR